MKKTNQLLMLIFSVLIVVLFVSCPGATGIMYSLTLNSSGATEEGTKVLYYSSIEKTWYGDVSASQKATRIEVPKKEYTVYFKSPEKSSQKYVQLFNGYYVGGTQVIDENGNILNNLKLTKSMKANASWKDSQKVILPNVDVADKQEFIGWLEEGSAESGAKKPGEEYTPVSKSTTLTGLIKDLSQFKIILESGANVLGENKGTQELWYNSYTKKYYEKENNDPKNPNQREMARITIPKFIRTISYDTNPSDAPDIDSVNLPDVECVADFKGYSPLIDNEGRIKDVAFTQQTTLNATWGEINPVKLETIENDGYSFLGWQETDGNIIQVGSEEFQKYTPKIEKNLLNAVWTSEKTYRLNLLSSGATQTHNIDQLFFRVDNSGRGGKWYTIYDIASSSESINQIQVPEKQFTVKLNLQSGEFVSSDSEEETNLSDELNVNFDFDGYYVSENAKELMIINPNGEFKDENDQDTAIYSEKFAVAHWRQNGGRLPSSDVVYRPGYSLAGWKTAEGSICEDPYVPTQKEETIYAYWTPNVYTLSLNLPENEYTSRGDTAVYYCTGDRWYVDREKTKDANWIITRPQRKYTVSYNSVFDDAETYSPSTAEYVFTGYYDENGVCFVDSNGKIISKGILTDDVLTPVEVYGKWSEPSLDLPSPVKNGYEFVGWREGEDESLPVIPKGEKYNPLSDITLYAVWSKISYSGTIEYKDGCDASSILGVENIYLNNGEGAVVTIRLADNAVFSDELTDDRVKSWFIYEEDIYEEDVMLNTFGQHLKNANIYTVNGGKGYSYITVVIKGLIDLQKKEETVVYSTNVIIPKEDIKFNYTAPVTIKMNYKVDSVVRMALSEDEALVGTVSYPLMGSVNARLGDSLTGVPLRIDLSNAYFKSDLDSSDIEAWFKPVSDELGNDIKYRIEDGGGDSGYVKILISGIPSNERRGNKTVTIPYSDLKGGFVLSTSSLETKVYYDTKYFLPVFEIELTAAEQFDSNETWANGESSSVQNQVMSFISLKGEQDWPVVWQKTASSTSVSPTDKASVKADFAIADTEVSAGFFMTVYKWALNNGYKFDFTSLPYLGYNKATDSSKNSALDPVTGISWYNAVVFCNAATEWYNATKNPSEPLTCAYKVGGTGAGEIIRDATYTIELDKIDPKQHLSLSKDYYSHVGDSTGFRLPTRTEWEYAASVSPVKHNETVSLVYSGTALPETFFASSYGTLSGAYDALLQGSSEYLLLYCVYSAPEFVSSDEYGTQYIGKYHVRKPYRTESKANDIGLYDMCGNVFEWAEDMESIGYRYVNGGSWDSNGLDYTIGSFDRSAPTLVNSSSQTVNSKNTGFRLCRNIR